MLRNHLTLTNLVAAGSRWLVTFGCRLFLAKLNGSVPLYHDKLFATLELQYHSSVGSLYNTRIDDYWLLNSTLFSQKIVQGLELTVSVQNLFDEKYAFPSSPAHSQAELPQLGRSLWLKLAGKF